MNEVTHKIAPKPGNARPFQFGLRTLLMLPLGLAIASLAAPGALAPGRLEVTPHTRL